MSRPNVADWQYLGVDKITRRLEWNSGRKARKGHICEDSLAYASYSSKGMNIPPSTVNLCDTISGKPVAFLHFHVFFYIVAQSASPNSRLVSHMNVGLIYVLFNRHINCDYQPRSEHDADNYSPCEDTHFKCSFAKT